MVEDRYVRWQGLAIGQLSFAINLLLGLSVGSLGFAVALVRDSDFVPSKCYAIVFLVASGLLGIAVACGIGAVVTRLLDFRFTAKKVRKAKTGDVAGLYSDVKALGNATWRLFYVLVGCFFLGIAGLVISVFSVYGGRFI